jgi:hypothetical protein
MSEATKQSEIQYILNAWPLFSIQNVLPLVFSLLQKFINNSGDTAALTMYKPERVAIFQQLRVSRKEKSWGAIREAVALYDLHLEIENAGRQDLQLPGLATALYSKNPTRIPNIYIWMRAALRRSQSWMTSNRLRQFLCYLLHLLIRNREP